MRKVWRCAFLIVIAKAGLKRNWLRLLELERDSGSALCVGLELMQGMIHPSTLRMLHPDHHGPDTISALMTRERMLHISILVTGKATCRKSAQKSPETNSPCAHPRKSWAQGPFHGACKQQIGLQ